MKAEGLTGYLSSAMRALGLSIYVPAGNEFADGLKIGDMVTGRVVRSYGGNRYVVSFGEHRQVVESTVPLRTKELFQGRVIDVGEQIELKRTGFGAARNKEDINPDSNENQATEFFANRFEKTINEVMRRYNLELSGPDKSLLASQLRHANEPLTMAMAGMVLAKLGLTQSSQLLRALYQSLGRREGARGMLSTPPIALELSIGEQGDGTTPANSLVAELMESLIAGDVQPETQGAEEGKLSLAGEGAENERIDIGKWVLNAQTGGSVSHRVATLPFWIDEELVEVDIALFDQRRHTVEPDGLRHRQIVFSLDTDRLGHIEIHANIAGDRVRLNIKSEFTETTETLSRYMDQLRQAIGKTGWKLDELVYGTEAQFGSDGVAKSVVEHIVTQDSLSRLM